MPGKSRSKKEKKQFRRVTSAEQPASVVPPAVQINIGESSTGLKATSTPAPAPAQVAKTTRTVSFANINIKRELLSITLLSAIMLAILIAASLILR